MLDKLATLEIQRESNRTQREFGNHPKTRIGVHVLSQFVYCPRAGIVAFESKPQENGMDFIKAPALGGLPTHDLDRIKRGIEEVDASLVLPIKWAVGSFLVFLALVLVNWELSVGPGIAVVIWLYQIARLVQIRIVLCYRLRVASLAARAEPDWTNSTIQPVNWWQLIQAGFVSREKREPLVDHAIGLTGKPWRVLHRDVWQLPVIRIEVKPEHIMKKRQGLSQLQSARIAAYAHLIFQTERLIAPWAIVLFNDSYEGIAVPIRSKSWEAFRKGLAVSRRHLGLLDEKPHYLPDQPNKIACKECRLGKPLSTRRPTILNDRPLAAYATTGRNDIPYHSVCGDRFRWVPPHQDALNLGLRD